LTIRESSPWYLQTRDSDVVAPGLKTLIFSEIADHCHHLLVDWQ
jgi:hypothetical protein